MVNGIRSRLSAAVNSLLLLCALWPHDAGAFVVMRTDPNKSKELELFQFVMYNEDKFRLVLNQQVQLDDEMRPPYQGEEVSESIHDALRMFGPEVRQISPYPVINKVLNDFMWLGSYVDYAASMFQTAFTCSTYTFLSIQAELIALIDGKVNQNNNSEAKTIINHTLEDAWKTLVMFMDKLAAVHSDLKMMADLSYVYVELIARSELNQMHVLKLMRIEIDKIINNKCVRQESDVIYTFFGITAKHSHLSGNESTHNDVLDVFEKLTEKLMKLYEEFQIHSMDYFNWKQILDFQIPVAKDVNVYLKINRVLRNDDLGRSILKGKKDRQEEIIESLIPEHMEIEIL